MAWIQRELLLPAFPPGYTRLPIASWRRCRNLPRCVGLLHVFIAHTSASLTINENADPDVLTDLNQALCRVAPTRLPAHYRRPRRHAGARENVADGLFANSADS